MKKDELNKLSEIVKGIPVFGVFKNYSADKGGIVRGDIIMEVNGIQTPTVDEYMDAVELDKDGKRQLKIWRNGQELDIELTFGEKIKEEELGDKIKESGIAEFLLDEQKQSLVN